ncbi:aldo/keto reductase [Salinibacillus xinjiangensis]|uniref:Aldo/keto reductase n=1 Tax=Salinibacillus xinjiangensis TaxID=1229268 RepID=A0A6G1X6B5_9BACI|nr:aldo/keto reductase [Salinibacillus xinjiangensis]MRG86482.1 aldo/keto reductase [Salinibacillus xinjiangensis]
MKKRQIGSSDLYVSEISLGCMSLGTDERKAKTIIDQALDAGINYLDTADLYDKGVNESIVGSAVKGKRDQVIIGTKVGNHFEPGKEGWYWDPSKAYIKEEVKESLRRLKTDYIDLYQLHGGTIEDPIDETIEAFEELKQEGLIRYYGISSIRPNVIREYIQKSNIVSVMMQYSLLDRRPEEEILDLLHDHQISVIARGPMAKGMLTTKGLYLVERKGHDGYLDYSYNELKTIISHFLEHSDQEISPNALALSYVLHHPALATATFGASSIEQLLANLDYESERLDDSLYQELQKLSKPITYDKHR